MLSQTLQITTLVSGADKGSLILFNPQQQPIQRFISQRDLPAEIHKQVALDVLEHGLAGWCVEQRKGAIIPNVEKDDRWHVFEDDSQTDVRSALSTPIMYNHEPCGVITLVHAEEGFFHTEHLQLVEAIANQASTAIHNAQLFDELQNKQQQLELLLHSSSSALMTVDHELKLVLINPKARELLTDAQHTALEGTNLATFPEDTLSHEIARQIRTLQSDQYSVSFDYFDEHNKRDLVVHITVIPNSRELHKPSYVINLHDVSNIKEFDRLKTQILHMLTHDLKNPINIVWGYVDLLRIDAEEGTPADLRFVEGMINALHRMDELIEETLDTERFIAARQMQPHYQISPNEIVEITVEGFSQLAENKGIMLQAEIEDDLDDVRGSAFQLREAMNNLISNAIKYTNQGGTVTVQAYQKEGQFHFVVSDTGVGIPKKLQAPLFDEFYRALRPETSKIEGTGLGLSLVKSTIESHKGEVWFKSEAGKGSTFGFWIPCA